MLAASTTAIGWVIFAVITLGWFVYYLGNRRSARAEVGSEVELAPNRRPYYDDETLEGRRLERVQLFGVLLLALIVIALPLYWVFEPQRQAGAQEAKEAQFVSWGSRLYATTEEGGFNCAGCHGATGAGGVAPYSITDPTTGEVSAVTWIAPAVNSVFYRFDESEVRFILVYGRPFSPMSPWGLAGGGPLNNQQIDTLIAKLWSLQIPRDGCPEGQPNCDVGVLPADEKERIATDAERAAQRLVDQGKYATVDAAMGEALFNLETAAGAYNCARCHTQGWSWGDPGVPGQGAFGWNLTGGSTAKHFPKQGDMEAFIAAGSEFGKRYGVQGQGSGRMPGFGRVLTEEQIQAVVEYVRSL
jgi:mono/diheme cytochrome c family protein